MSKNEDKEISLTEQESSAGSDEKELSSAKETASAEKPSAGKKDKAGKPKKKFNSKKLKYGSAATALTVVVIAAVVLVNVIVKLVGDRVDLTIDLTSDSIFEISQESIDYLASLNQDVEIVTMQDESIFRDSGDIYYKQAYEVMKKYEYNSDRITLNFVDMTADPTYANKYGEIYKGTISQYSIVVTCGDRIKVLSVNDLFNTEMDYNTFSYNIVSSKAEQVLTSAIMYVTDPEPKKAVILDVETAGIANGTIQNLLENDGFDVSSVNPLTEIIPTDPDVIVINAPLNDFSEEIIDRLYEYIENEGNYGKNIIYLASYSQKSTANIDAFLAEWGIVVERGVVGDENSNNLATRTTYYAIKNYIESNDYSANVAQPELPVISYNARPITLMYELSGNVETVPLLSTEDTGFVFTDEMQELVQAGTEPEIVNGSYTTVALSHKYTFNSDNEQIRSHLLVFGSSDMLDSGLTGSTYYNNGDYFVSILNTMTGKTAGINIVAKDLNSATFDTDVKKASISFWVFMVIIPLAVLASGVAVWLKRRHM